MSVTALRVFTSQIESVVTHGTSQCYDFRRD